MHRTPPPSKKISDLVAEISGMNFPSGSQTQPQNSPPVTLPPAVPPPAVPPPVGPLPTMPTPAVPSTAVSPPAVPLSAVPPSAVPPPIAPPPLASTILLSEQIPFAGQAADLQETLPSTVTAGHPMPRQSSGMNPMTSKAMSTASKASSRRRASLQLKRLEEERLLQERYLSKKYQILEDNLSEDEDDVEDDLNGNDNADGPPTSSKNVENWLKMQTKHGNVTFNADLPNNSTLNNNWLGLNVNQNHDNTLLNTNNVERQTFPQSTNNNNQIPQETLNDFQDNPTLTRRQLAARHSTPKDLPRFNGDPEDWALFISCFESSTRICGFSSEENLVRLRASLRGKALDAVRSRLSQPGQVDRIISTLQMMFGRPEIIINTLLSKLKQEPLPKADKLESILKYSLEVESICATMEVSGCSSHLNNPILLQELVERLPPTLRLNWSIYKQTLSIINISQFSSWLFEVGRAANDVIFSGISSPEQKSRQERSHLNIHNEVVTSKKCKICEKNCTSLAKCQTFLDYSLQQRWSIVKEKHLCRTCLRRHNNKCQSKQLCGENNCAYRHHKLLHNYSYNQTNAPKYDIEKSDSSKKTTVGETPNSNPFTNTFATPFDDSNKKINNTVPIPLANASQETKNLQISTASNSIAQPTPSTSIATQTPSNCHTHQKENAILFRVLPVTLYGKERKVETFAFLDDGSSTPLLESQLADDLQLEGENLPLHLKWTSNVVREEANSRKVDLDISGADMQNKFSIHGVRTVEDLDLPQQTINAKDLCKRYVHLKGVPLMSFVDAKPRILIGLKHWNLGIPLRTKEGNTNEPVATKTRLGWVAFGPCDITSVKNLSLNFQLDICPCRTGDDLFLNDSLKDYFAMENVGTKKVLLMSPEEDRAQKILDTHSKRIKDKFEVPLLWRNDNLKLPKSETYAYNRLLCLERRLVREPHIKILINNLIEDYVIKGYARKIDPKSEVTGKTWYLPIFPVLNPNKPNKIRIVWDAAAKINGVSLNSALLTGPDITSPLLGVLFRFRERNVGLCADIKEMFHQVQIKADDQEAQRFLWRNAKTNEVETYILQVMSFGATSSPFCAQYIKNRNAQEFNLQFPDAAKAIIRDHYVDDYIASYDNDEEAARIAKDVIHVHSKGGFEIRNFRSNSSSLLDELKCHSADKCSSVSLSNAEKVLGLWWSPTNDEWFFIFNSDRMCSEVMSGKQKPTKREVLQFLMRIYDPLGLIANILVNVKILLQSIWRSGVDWDEKIRNEHFVIWNKWLRLLPEINNIKIPRRYLTVLNFLDADSVELHIFCDASEEALASAAYIRVMHGEEIECRLIAAKTKVAPLRHISIPRMELEAAVLGSRLATTIIESHSIKFTRQIYWTDSKTVIYWLRSPSRKFQQFVSLRIGEILEKTHAEYWKWVPSKENVADEATKTRMNFDFSSQSPWYRGPDFLWLNENFWPKCKLDSIKPDSEFVEHLHHSTKDVNQEWIINFHKFSNWRELLNAMSRVYLFIDWYFTRNPDLTLQQFIDDAERCLWRRAQRDVFSEEIILLDAVNIGDRVFLPKTSLLYKLSPYIDEHNVLRISGRIDAAVDVDFGTKRPVVLPKDHHITFLILDHYHRKFKHQYNETVVNEVRQRFYIPALRIMVKKVQRKCQECRNQRAEPVIPVMAELPSARLKTYTKPFSYVGIDYFGPMLVTVGRRVEKRWGVIFTCLTIRAIHVEVAHSLSTSSCIQALKRFVSRRGTPIQIYTDNGTNFRGASRELKAAVEQINGKKLVEGIGEGRVKWSFIPPAAPHMGGCWERLVRSVKQTLLQMKFTRNPSDELLNTMMAEVEGIINSRPLTYVPVSCEDDEALTPNHFLLGSSNGSKPLGECKDEGIILKQNWMMAEQLSNSFWRRWIREYLPTLTRRTKWFQHTKPISVDDIVIIIDENNAKNEWPKGRVLELNTSRDGKIRSVVIQTKSGVYVRPVSKLAVLDVADSTVSGKPDQLSILPGGNVENHGNTGAVEK
ncbi:uncharacterized protein LOC129945285 [Eupeodes corollae]|uniref:uncharacterized protein LOC129945285 n=1 Tax=Eupeodes corollae TaxID=290404 RepID=UPI002493606D|nr:uncharacterized protein LOC129945285 [Eupeodes corollae]